MSTRRIAIALLGCMTALVADARPPNVVILYADDMGCGDVAAANAGSRIPTPHLDRLAREGTRFTDAHSSSGVCTPSRYALLHGRYHWRKFHGIVDSFDQPVLDADRPTIASMLKDSGYRTAAFGKWHLGWDWAAIRVPQVAPQRQGNRDNFPPEAFDWSRRIPGGPLAFGFDRYVGDDVPNFPPYAWIIDDRVEAPPTTTLTTTAPPTEGNWECRPGPAVADWDFTAVMPRIVSETTTWLETQSADAPFFLYVAFTSPHAPIVPAAAFRGTTEAGGYGDFVAQTDAAVGRILDALERRGLADDTIVVFTADNGPEHYAYERVRRTGHRSMGPFRGLKRDLWEGGHRVPFLVRWPGHVPAGSVSDGLVGQIDLFATIAACTGTPIPARAAEDSLDQTALFTGLGASARRELVHNTQPGRYALRSDEWVYIDPPGGGVTAMPAWFREQENYPDDAAGGLYDLRGDPGQRRNLLVAEPRRVATMRERLDQLVGERRQADRARK